MRAGAPAGRDLSRRICDVYLDRKPDRREARAGEATPGPREPSRGPPRLRDRAGPERQAARRDDEEAVSIDPIKPAAGCTRDRRPGNRRTPRPRDDHLPSADERPLGFWRRVAAIRGTFASGSPANPACCPKIRPRDTLATEAPGSSHGPSAAPSSTRPPFALAPPRHGARQDGRLPIRSGQARRFVEKSRRLRGRATVDARQLFEAYEEVGAPRRVCRYSSVKVASVRVLTLEKSRRSRAVQRLGGWIAFSPGPAWPATSRGRRLRPAGA